MEKTETSRPKTGEYRINFYDKYGSLMKDLKQSSPTYTGALTLGWNWCSEGSRADRNSLREAVPASFSVDRRLFNSLDAERDSGRPFVAAMPDLAKTDSAKKTNLERAAEKLRDIANATEKKQPPTDPGVLGLDLKELQELHNRITKAVYGLRFLTSGMSFLILIQLLIFLLILLQAQ